MSSPRAKLLLGTYGLGAVVLGVAVFSNAGPIAAQPVPPVASTADDKKNKPQSIDVMTFPSDRDAKNMIQAVKDYLKEYETKWDKAPWDKICFAAQQVLDAKSDSFFELPKPSPEAPPGRVSAKAEVNRLIGQFPPAGRQFYQLNFGPQAETLVADAKAKGYDRAILADASQRYFHTKGGAQATLLLAGVQLDRGNFVEAAYSYERLLARPESEDLWTPRAIIKAMAAIKRAGAGPNSASYTKLAGLLEKKFPRDGLTLGKKAYTLDELKQEIDRPFETLFGRISETFVSMRYGNPSHTAVGEGSAPFLDRSYGIELPYKSGDGNEGSTWVRQNLEDVLKGSDPKKDLILPGSFPVTTQNLVMFRNYDGVYAVITKDGFSNQGVAARAGDIYWISAADAGCLASQAKAPQDKETELAWKFYRDTANLKSILYDNPLAGSLAHDGQLAYYIDEAALPPPPQQQNENFGFQPPPPTGKGSPLAEGNLLKAIHIVTGCQAWLLGKTFEGTPLSEEELDKTDNALLLMQGSFFLGPPLPLNGKLYVLFEKNGIIRLACLDPGRLAWHTSKRHDTDSTTDKPIEITDRFQYPVVLWSQRLGEPNMKLPLDTYRRFQCSYLAYADGVMVCPTNSGAVIAVDIMSRSLLWAKSYRAIKQATTDNERMGRGGRIMNNGQTITHALEPNRWRAAAPIISQGRVVFTAYDSEPVYCLDLRTGDTLWTEPRKASDLYVGGLIDDKVVIVGKDSVRAMKLYGAVRAAPKPDGREDATAAWKDLKIGIPAGHGAASKGGTYYLPVAAGTESGEPQVWAINVAKGEVTGKAAYRKREGVEAKPMLGNLLFHEDQLFSQSPTELTAFPLLEIKKQEMDRLLAANPNDPVGLTARGEMLLDDGKISAAIADFTAAGKNAPPEFTLQRLRDKRYVAYTELLRKDFKAGEPYLAEYKSLCIVPAEVDDPNQKLRLVTENLKRQRLYLELIARGRENQGRLAEAFDHYLEYAALGGGKELVEVSDEAGVKSRPDVWARGRIEAMIANAKDPAARKPLEARVEAEWRVVKDGASLDKLREFVAVFGHHFDTGREAQLELANRLIAENTDEGTREAQTVLAKLQATTDDSALAARAVETLARLMVRRGQMESAVALYAQLGSTYALQPIREGKFGADYFNDQLTDKRLLPYLEPGRITTPARITTKSESSQNGYVQPGFVIDPDGDKTDSYFRRHRLTLSNNDSGNGSWTLRSFDRASGEEKAKFTSLKVLMLNGNSINYRIAQAQGSLLLMHLGTSVHCFDMVEKKQLWEYSVFGDNSKIDFNNLQMSQGNNPNNDDEVVFNNADGTRFTLGRTTILEPNFACLVTRDGLVALDPATGTKLWARTNIGSSATIFGDARHVFVVETAGGKTTSRVLRAIDGSPVEGIADFSTQVSGAARVRIVGRNILLSEGGRIKPLVIHLYDPLTGKDLWSKAYDPAKEPEDYKSRGLEFNGQAKLLKTFGPDWTGAFQRDGKFEVLDVRSGAVVFAGRIDAGQADLVGGMTAQPVLLADAERFYLLLNRTADNNRNVNYGYANLRAIAVTGPAYCFQRSSGKRLWFTDKLFDGQQLVIERFGELPALVAATNTPEDANGNSYAYRVIVVDKANGKVRYLKNLGQNSAFFGMSTDPRLGTASFLRQDGKLTILPDDEPKPAAGK